MKVREAIVQKDGLEFRAGDRVRIVTRSGSDEECYLVLAEALNGLGVTAADFVLGDRQVQLLPDGVLTVITARERDPGLWAQARLALIEAIVALRGTPRDG